MEGLWEENPRFGEVWRGYDRNQVEKYLRRPQDSDAPPRFDVVLRGYDREEVDRYVGR
ncbi:DivIVA domain-containing protein [Actinomadura sp. DC4]|uniref:DivIVA domain-containing protein n=1 Tax=Actinomadura sp. DC4 TaxID=3055069 RepID=UPI0025AF73B2|nr:DivIVA domain-containing protein [Actinomadura sp. DC4]MDN3353482.1 DivIVA domain-containing protein [Actinomadura sp. DC4]